MKRIILFIAIIAMVISAQAQLEVKKGIKVGSTTITNSQLGKIPEIDNKSNKSDEIKFTTYLGLDSLIFDGTKKRLKYLSPDHFWRTIAIHDSAIVSNWTGLKTGMTSAWEFDETSGTDAVPAIGTLHGTANGGVTVNQTGKIGKCWTLDNTNGYISFANNALLDLTNNWSISVWFKATDYTTNRYIFTKGTGVYYARVNTSGPQFRFGTSALSPTAANATTFTPVANEWTHLVLTYSNGVGVKVYWNGVYKETLAMSGTLATDAFPLLLGRYTGTEIFNGSFDQFIIWKSRVVSDADVTTLYNSGNGMLISLM